MTEATARMTSRSDPALSLAGEGHPVLPLHTPSPAGDCSCRLPTCSRAGKHPRGGLGLHHATSNPGMVAAWWDSWPQANIGLRCDGLAVFDLDGAQGEESLERLTAEFGPLPPTRTQRTGKGRHLLYAVPSEARVGNSTRRLGSPPGVDLRGGPAGYIVVAPSLHASGAMYAWDDLDAPVSGLPASYLETLTRPPAPAAMAPMPPAAISTRYGRAALRSEMERLLGARERNEALNLAVFRLAQLVAGGELNREELERKAWTFALLVGLEPGETRATIRSALRGGLTFPRRRL
jgi:Bifunctional DNA primase/polymerase, N-terminal